MHLFDEESPPVPSNNIKKELLKTIRLKKEKNSDEIGIILGMDTEHHIMISKLKPDGLAEKNGRFKAGDRVLWINEMNVEELDVEKAQDIINKTKLRLHIVIARCHENPMLQREDSQTTLKEAQLIPNLFDSEEPYMFEVTYLGT